jgi:hypothetical protein
MPQAPQPGSPGPGDLRVFIRRGVLALVVPTGVGFAALTVILTVTTPGRSAAFYTDACSAPQQRAVLPQRIRGSGP